MLNRSASLAMSTSVLEALPGKFDIKRHSPSILYISLPDAISCDTLLYRGVGGFQSNISRSLQNQGSVGSLQNQGSVVFLCFFFRLLGNKETLSVS